MKNTHSGLPQSKLIEKQTKQYVYKNVKTEEYGRVDFIVNVRYDDSCYNGHNTFAITGDIYETGKRHIDRNMVVCGAIGDTIGKYIPELAHLNKWHLCSSDEPVHYVANTTCHARTTSHTGKEVGEPVSFEYRLKFEKFPMTFKEQETSFWEYLSEVGDFNNIDVEEIPYDGTCDYNYEPNYSLTGFIKDNQSKKWYRTPFNSKRAAKEFLSCLRLYKFTIVEVPTDWCKAVEPNLEAARSCAIWPDATLEQLQSEEALLARLPELMQSFKDDIEALGFEY